ncbi:hmannose-1-phosphateguanyl transferase [Haloferula helveola]|uniref:Hmannose-1-phosphateguanyl transferase n=1 Tax=Haloferula helveola TaxID=490095 RepID=A0ABM7RFT9_9BACT|nr:hmannose-1-phosphateguanyl transferase [Haloferula helveola]
MPIFSERAIEDFPIGNLPFSEHHKLCGRDDVQFHSQAWVSPEDLAHLSSDGPTSLLGAQGAPLAWLGNYPDLEATHTADNSFLVVHPWDLIRANELYVGSIEEDVIEGDVHSMAVIGGKVRIGKGTRILPGVVIEGNVVIGANCKIGPNCYIRGNTSIGDHCHIGNAVEIKNSILLSHTNVGHLSYVGDSILGERVNFGAGTVTSNLRHDGKTHRTMVGDVLVNTGRRKFGCIVGDGVHTGINTSIYPGRKLFPGTSTRPGEIVQRDLHPSP